MARKVKIPSEDAVLDYLRHSRRGPIKAKEIAKGMDVAPRDFRDFRLVLRGMLERGRLYRVKGQRYAVPEKANLVAGRLAITQKGDGFVAPDTGGQDVFVPGLSLESAMDGDQVVVRVEGRPRGRSPVGRVIKVLDRAHETVVGTFRRSGSFGVVHPRNRRISREILVAQGDQAKASEGDVVVARITTFGSGKMGPTGRIETVLGKSSDPGVDILSVIHDYGLPLAFPESVVSAARDAVSQRRKDPGELRTDRRDLHVFTIDPADAKDHDDGLSIRPLEDESWEVGIHIADVSHFVRPDDEVDLEAFKRGTSVYLVDRVIPMLPHELSTDACSLLPDTDRFAVSVFATVDPVGRVREARFERTEIRSRHKLSYEEAQAVLDNKKSIDRQTDEALRALAALAEILRERRKDRGSLDFDLPEGRVLLGEKGEPVSIRVVERLESHRLVEAFMLLANEIAAREAAQKRLPILYRVHEPPPTDKMRDLRTLLGRLSHRVSKGNISQKDLQAILKQVEGRPEEKLVSTVILRSMSRARYDVRNLGHYGLASDGYTHFTSPIRRYPDLWLHRVLVHTLVEGHAVPEHWEGPGLKDRAERCSVRERVAEAAERESVDLKKVEYMERHLGDDFFGTVSGVTSFGIFVLLDDVFVEGLVHVNSMNDDYYIFRQDQYLLVGERSHRSFRLGDRLRIRVARVDKEERFIDFVIVDSTKRAKKHPPSP
ncbi:MAG TPA: ribonuclease R [Gemmatimonadetes bacterium]|nr:ribonuclease R [Gemmatimonadota bacterium]